GMAQGYAHRPCATPPARVAGVTGASRTAAPPLVEADGARPWQPPRTLYVRVRAKLEARQPAGRRWDDRGRPDPVTEGPDEACGVAPARAAASRTQPAEPSTS